MQTSIKGLVAGVLLSCPILVWAEEAAQEPSTNITANVTLTSDYVFRGITQTFGDPAIQGGFDYAHPTGFYVGTWASNVSSKSFNDGGLELDIYGGYAGSITDDFGYNVGLIQYIYPGAETATTPSEDYDTVEAYAGVTYKFFNLKYSATLTDYFGTNENTGTPANGDSKGSDYVEANINYELMNKFMLGLHVGHQRVENYGHLDYTDYKIGVSKELAGLNFGLAYTSTDADSATYTVSGKDISDDTFIVSVSKTF